MPKKLLLSDCAAIRSASPLVLNITNYVAMNLSANALLAVGASPIMSSFADELPELILSASSLCINIGCLDNPQILAMNVAADKAHSLSLPWILDPAGAGASAVRTDTCVNLIRSFHPAVIRGNASEILSLYNALSSRYDSRHNHGVDSVACPDDVASQAQALARLSGSVVSVSGASDLITDGLRMERTSGGSAIMPRITAMGCTASALVAAFLAVQPDAFLAALDAAELMKSAADMVSSAKGPASFETEFIDNLYNIAYAE